MTTVLLKIYAVLASLFFGIVFTAQILGFIGIYYPLIAIPLTLISSISAYIAYQHFASDWYTVFDTDQTISSLLSRTIIAVSIVLVLIIFVQRMVLWSQSTLAVSIPADFGGYHSIKALQLYRTGSVWDLSIPYGQYPFGYESLIAFGMFFTGNIQVTGTVHASIFILLWLTITLLMMRYARLPLDVSLLLAILLCFAPTLFPQLMNIGKNDSLLTLTILMAVLYAPIGDERFHPLGLAFATMLALATKTTVIIVLFYLWGLVMLNWGLHWRKQTWQSYLHPSTFALVIALMFPGGLWVIRNYIVMGEVISSEISSFFQTSIFANLNNPNLYNSGDSSSLLFVAILILILSVASLFYKHLRWQWALLLIVLAVSFMITPLSAFLTTLDLDYLDVQWRFVLYGIVLVFVTMLALIAPILRHIYAWVYAHTLLSRLASLGLIISATILIFIIGIEDIFGYDKSRWDTVIDPTLEDNSIYDALSELEPSTLYMQNLSWLAIYLNNPDLTVTELRFPLGRAEIYPEPEIDYIVFHQRFSFETISYDYDPDEWELIYDNSVDFLYRRIR
ncbi:MAG: hypothetical protein Phog2KO_17800 [Phototrophicaceae bacterium]